MVVKVVKVAGVVVVDEKINQGATENYFQTKFVVSRLISCTTCIPGGFNLGLAKSIENLHNNIAVLRVHNACENPSSRYLNTIIQLSLTPVYFLTGIVE